MEIDVKWHVCHSESDLNERLSHSKFRVFEKLRCDHSSSWGYVELCLLQVCIPIETYDSGLPPQVIHKNESLFLGINDVVVSYDLDNGQLNFVHRVPTVFHQFIIGTEALIFQDEIGFVSLSASGKVNWSQTLDDIIDEFEVFDYFIRGKTIEGETFNIPLDGIVKDSEV